MRLFTGQPDAMPLINCPVWQNGMPQSMQRAPWWRNLSTAKCSWNSFQSFTRSSGERSLGSSRSYSMKPVGLPIAYPSPADNKTKARPDSARKTIAAVGAESGAGRQELDIDEAFGFEAASSYRSRVRRRSYWLRTPP